jgi:transposase-like protein
LFLFHYDYTKEYKEEAVKLVSEQGYSLAEAGRNLGVNANMLGRWKREIEGAVEDDKGRKKRKKGSHLYH